MFKIIDLPYAPDGLEPVISARTLEFHHGKHLQAYVDNLNKLLPGSGLEDLPLEEIVRKAAPSAESPVPAGNLTAIFNNAGQVLNHNLYFTQFAPASHRSALVPGGDCVALNIPVGQWHTVEVLESGTVILEAKDGAYEPTVPDDILA